MSGVEYFISGIDTDCGKTYTTGLLAYHLKKTGKKVMTSKLVQTGCKGVSSDIKEHRQIMESGLLPEDISGLSCPYVYSYPASPHLSARLDNKPLNLNIVRRSAKKLLADYEILLTEGAGGIMVPVTNNYFILDYIKDHRLPLILISSSKLGSINHTIMCLELCLFHKVDLLALIYNRLPGNDNVIANDTYLYLKDYLKIKFKDVQMIHSDQLDKKSDSDIINFLL